MGEVNILVRLTVMSYNVLGFNRQTAPMLKALRAANADEVALQELCPEKALAIRDELSAS